MGYAKLDDRLPYHRKVRSIPPKYVKPCYAIYVAGIQFCQAYGTDGRIRHEDLHLLLPTAPKPTKAELQALVNAGLWDEAIGGWVIHDYLEHNASAEERKAKARTASNARWNAHRNALSNASSNPSPLLSSPLVKTPVVNPRGHDTPGAPTCPVDSDGLSALRESEKAESRRRFAATVEAVSKRIGMPLTAEGITKP